MHQTRTVLRNHRGMTEPHMKRAAEWFLTLQEIPIDQAHELAKTPPATQNPTNTEDPEPATSNQLYDTALNPEEGLWLRAGWAGRQ